MPPRYAEAPIPVEQYQQQQQGQIMQVPPDATTMPVFSPPSPPQQPSDKTPLLYVLVVAALGAVGWWAYKSMEKDRKFKLGSGPRRMEAYDGGDDDGPEDDGDSESDGPLDAYENADVDEDVRSPPHEKGGIKLVKG